MSLAAIELSQGTARVFARALSPSRLLLVAPPGASAPAAAARELLRAGAAEEIARAALARAGEVEQRGVAGGAAYAVVRAAGSGGRGDASAEALASIASAAAASSAAAGSGAGLRAWLAAHHARGGALSQDSRALQRRADEDVRAFEAGESEADRAKRELAARMQADGFTLVTRRSRLESEEGAAESANAKRKRRRGDVAAAGFYGGARAIAAERKSAKLETLRSGFAEDRAALAALKAKRRADFSG